MNHCPNCTSDDISHSPKRGFVCAACGYQTSGTADFPDLEKLPLFVALPLRDYLTENHPVLKLWNACYSVELLLRLLVMLGVGELAHNGQAMPAEVIGKIRKPTLGSWQKMAESLADALKNSPRLPHYSPLIAETLKPFLDGGFLKLRNDLAHGTGMAQKLAAGLVSQWETRFIETLRQAAWLADRELCARQGGRFYRLHGFQAVEISPLAAESPDNAVFSGDTLLWPLALYGLPQAGSGHIAECPAAQVYSRHGEINLHYVPLGSEELSLSEAGDAVLTRFEALFRAPEPETPPTAFKIRDFQADILQDAPPIVAATRAEELRVLKEALKQPGLIWVHGAAGIGKSALLAHLAAELCGWTDDAPALPDTLILPYRFKTDDAERCRQSVFFSYVLERLESHLNVKPDEKDLKESPENRYKNLVKQLGTTRLLRLLDGLDEIHQQDKSFLNKLRLLAQAQVTVLCAGRPEPELQGFLSKQAIQPFPEGVPRLTETGTRALLLAKISESKKLRDKLLKLDTEANGAVTNRFIERVAQAADGLPLYVQYVGEDLAQHALVLDAAVPLLNGLAAYHESLLQRYGIGTLQQILTPLACTLAAAQEALSEAALAALVARYWQRIPDETHWTRKALAVIAAMLKTHAAPDGEILYSLYHESLREHLRTSKHSKDAVIAAENNLASAALDLRDGPAAPYLYRNGPYHLHHAGQDAELKEKLLLNYHWMQKKLDLAGVDALIAGYDFLSDDPVMNLLQETLRLSAHVLRVDTKQLPSQLHGRLLNLEEAEIKAFLHESVKPDFAWLRPLKVCLEEPGENLVKIISRHISGINDIAVTSDGNYLVSSGDLTVRLWDIDKGTCIHSFWGHSDIVTNVLLINDDKYIVSASKDCTLKLWDVKSKKCIHTFIGHSERINDVAVTPDSKYILSASSDHTVKIWDLSTKVCISTFLKHFSSVETIRVSSDGKSFLSIDYDEIKHVWDINLRLIESFEKTERFYHISKDTKFIISRGETIEIIEIENHKNSISFKSSDIYIDNGRNIIVNYDSKYIIYSTDDNSRSLIKVYYFNENREITIGENGCGASPSLLLRPNHDQIISISGERIKIWKIPSSSSEVIGKSIHVEHDEFVRCLFAYIAGDRAGQLYFLRLENLDMSP